MTAQTQQAEQQGADSTAPAGSDYVAIGRTSLALMEELFKLVGMEARQAVSSIPNALLAWLMTIPVVVLAWLGLSVSIGWLAFSQTGYPVIGMLVFTALQFLSLLGLRIYLHRVRHWMSFPYTRDNIKSFTEGINRAADKTLEKAAAQDSGA